jgi:hypothetical protein
MRNRTLKLTNYGLLIGMLGLVAHAIHTWRAYAPTLLVNPPIQCGDVPDSDADYLARIIQAVIKAKGPLPSGDPIGATHVISENASALGFTWPSDYKINGAGLICDCKGEPYEISILADRVIVTSPSLYSFYFVNLINRKRLRTGEQQPKN